MKRMIAILIFLYAVSLSAAEGDKSKNFNWYKIIPDISLITDFSYLYRTISNDVNQTIEVPAFTHSQAEESEHGHAHTPLNANNGFNFNYAELVLESAVDPYFHLYSVFHLGVSSFEVEEIFARTTAIPGGLQVKAGKFLSGFGRLNGQHSHNWSFSDQPLVYNAFLGMHGLNELGLQITWVAPVDSYLLIGVEVLDGSNESSFGKKGFSSDSTATGSFSVATANFPNAFTAFVKTSFDAGDVTFLLGASGIFGFTKINHGAGTKSDENYGFSGQTWIASGEVTVKWQPDAMHYLELQGEFIYRDQSGIKYYYESGTDAAEAALIKRQSGFYLQLVGKVISWMRIGARYEMLFNNSLFVGGVDQTSTNPAYVYKTSAMIDFLPSEFSMFRLQYNYDMSKYRETEVIPNHEIIVQATFSIGKHGAHSF